VEADVFWEVEELLDEVEVEVEEAAPYTNFPFSHR
jgi:hypothetical protein